MILEITSIFYIFKRKVNFFKEQTWQNTAGIPSTACLDAWVDYYSESHMIDINVAFFKDMVKNWGTPDWPNPYPPATIEYYKIHPQGFLMWDFEKILTPISPPGTLQEDCFNEIGTKLSLEDSHVRGMRRYTRQNNIKNACIDCIAILLAENCSLSRIASIVNNKDLKAVLTEAIVYGDYEVLGYDVKPIIKNAYKQKLINEDDINKLYNTRMMVDLSERYEVEKAPEPDEYNPNLPKLDLKSKNVNA